MSSHSSQSRTKSTLTKLGNAISGGPAASILKKSIGLALNITDAMERSDLNNEAYEDLARFVAEIMLSVGEGVSVNNPVRSESLRRGVVKLDEALEEILAGAISLARQPSSKAYATAGQNADWIAASKKKLNEAILLFGLKTLVNVQTEGYRTETAIIALIKEVEQLKLRLQNRSTIRDDKEDSRLLRELLPVPQAPSQYAADPCRGCLKGTRVTFIEQVLSWAQRANITGTSNVLWICGMGGCGKTAIAHTIADSLNEKGLVSSFFFKRADKALNGLCYLFTSLARDLSQHELLRGPILQALKERDTMAHQAPSIQFTELILNSCATASPLASLSSSGRLSGPIYVIWDALDECESNDLKTLLRLLERPGNSTNILSIPAIQFIFTSQPHTDIGDVMNRLNAHCLTLSPNTAHTDEDISMFLEDILQKAPPHNLSSNWITAEDIAALVEHAGGLFIWAQIAANIIKAAPDPKEKLAQLLREGVFPPNAALDELYAHVISNSSLKDYHQDYQLVIGSLLTLQTPLAPIALQNLVQPSKEKILNIVQRLGAVLIVTSENDPVHVYHPTFSDYLTSPHCIEGFYIDKTIHHGDLAKSCLVLMRRVFDQDVDQHHTPLGQADPSTQSHIFHNQAEPEALNYACLYWVQHLKNAAPGTISALDFHINAFYSCDLLLWLKFMSTSKNIPSALLALREAHRVSIKHYTSSLRELAYDAVCFAEKFAHLLNTNPSHIYISALAFTPEDTAIYRHFHSLLSAKSELCVFQGKDRGWSPCRMTLEGHRDKVVAVAISQDGLYIASASHDKTVCIWAAESGQLIWPPLEHSAAVSAVAFSVKSVHRLASGSQDGTLCIWDADNGRQFRSMPVGHQKQVTSVVFSHDGAYIISASLDGTVQVWDIQSCSLRFLPLNHHDATRAATPVYCVAISKDDQLIVSACHDRTIHVWNAINGQATFCPFIAHANRVLSVAISNDNSQIISSSKDKTIRCWSLHTGQPLRSPGQCSTGEIASVTTGANDQCIYGSYDKTVRVWKPPGHQVVYRGHTDSVKSVAFSCPGRQIISGSHDKTLRIWDLDTNSTEFSGLLGSSPVLFQTHTDRITVLAFSSDGGHIVSGSDDKTLRVWQVATGQCKAELKGHIHPITCATFSNDGQHIVSGSRDKTVCVWNAWQHACCPLILPLKGEEGHTNFVRSVALSRDGQQIASGSDDCTIRLWSRATGQQLGVLKGHRGKITSLAFSRNGCHLISGSTDKTVYMWDTNTCTCVWGPLRAPNLKVMVTSVLFSNDETHILSVGQDGKQHVWSALTGRHVRSAMTDSEKETLRDSIAYPIPRFSLTKDFWICVDTKEQLCWVPAENRGEFASSRTHVALGGGSGKITIVRLLLN